MKIWLSKNSEIPVREQLTLQVILGVASGDLPVGARLPSTREIARRFGVHPNTVSGAYQELVAQGWLEFRRGSGFYVSRAKPETLENPLDKIIAEFFHAAQKQGFSIEEIKTRLAQFFEMRPPERFLLVESDKGLREILIEEIKSATGFHVSGMSFEDFQKNDHEENSVFIAMFDEKAKIRSVISSDKNCVFLKARSVADTMKDERRPTGEDLIAVVSGWENFLRMAKTMLIAAHIEPESLIVRSTKQPNWKNGLKSASMIICDVLTARKMPKDGRIRAFQLISEESFFELRRFHKKR